MALFPIAAFIFCALVSILSIRRALRVASWLKMKGTVLGPAQGSVDSSGVRIRFTDPKGQVREFNSGIQFGHAYITPFEKRIPFKPGEEISIRVNPEKFDEGEIESRLLYALPALLLGATFWIGYRIFRA